MMLLASVFNIRLVLYFIRNNNTVCSIIVKYTYLRKHMQCIGKANIYI